MALCRPIALALALVPLVSCDDRPSGETWSVVFSELEPALLSVNGTRSDDVWVVGTDDGEGPAILHYDGSQWSRIGTEARGDLWWVNATDDDIWMAGDAGLVLHLRRGDERPRVLQAPTDLRLFGIFEAAPNDVWAVGGDPERQAGIVLRYDTQEWREVEVPSEAADGSFFKIWGPAADDLWIVGHGGVALHWDGSDLTSVPLPVNRPLLTVHGDGQDIVAVGGFASGYIVALEGDTFVDATPTGTAVPQLNGVYVSEEGTVAAGTRGELWRRDDTGWTRLADAPSVPRDYHSVYVDDEGGIWAVGGDIVAPPLRNGILTHHGAEIDGALAL